MVKFEVIGEEAESLRERVCLILERIEKESSQFHNFLNSCIKKYEEELLVLNYDLGEKEVDQIGNISREACNYYDNGVFLLFLYFVQSMQRLEKQGRKVEEIEGLMEEAINKISKKYPPG